MSELAKRLVARSATTKGAYSATRRALMSETRKQVWNHECLACACEWNGTRVCPNCGQQDLSLGYSYVPAPQPQVRQDGQRLELADDDPVDVSTVDRVFELSVRPTGPGELRRVTVPAGEDAEEFCAEIMTDMLGENVDSGWNEVER